MIEKEINEPKKDVKEDKEVEIEPLTDRDWSFYNDHDDAC
tara:strand:+ start:810 stop:929 length:120 start_codon:yes stop_codon:yes gene_type:complete